ncbi:hypothetical protein TNCT_247871 [Trichonephila clavata]|uniref:Uncharacterized protein n=1 Tax=Trichonephila clavata TaxID=2740835 RepID=A0A8X6J6C6_TRICU|nr:hypothetical protein TNCT_247871 [Trichonephila clavata]
MLISTPTSNGNALSIVRFTQAKRDPGNKILLWKVDSELEILIPLRQVNTALRGDTYPPPTQYPPKRFWK